MIWVAINRMGDEHRVEAESEEEAREAALVYFDFFAKREWAGCYGKRRLASVLQSLEPGVE